MSADNIDVSTLESLALLGRGGARFFKVGMFPSGSDFNYHGKPRGTDVNRFRGAELSLQKHQGFDTGKEISRMRGVHRVHCSGTKKQGNERSLLR